VTKTLGEFIVVVGSVRAYVQRGMCTYARTSLKAFVKGQVNVLLLSESSKELFLWSGDTYLAAECAVGGQRKNGISVRHQPDPSVASYAGFFLNRSEAFSFPGEVSWKF
jgi:hypothetical protein